MEKDPTDVKVHHTLNDTAIDIQKEFAIALLNHTNPYTGLRYIDDPAIALIDYTNENTMYLGYISNDLNGPIPGRDPEQSLYTLPSYYSGQLDIMWNRFLTRRYGDRAHLESIWAVGEVPIGPNIIQSGDFVTDLNH